MNKKKPCPFCGCRNRKVGIRRMGNKGYSVVCGNCGGKGPYVTIKDWNENKMVAQEQAITEWNRRVADEHWKEMFLWQYTEMCSCHFGRTTK